MNYLLIACAFVVAACVSDPEAPTVHNITVECKADTVLVVDSLGNFSQRLCIYGDPKPPGYKPVLADSGKESGER